MAKNPTDTFRISAEASVAGAQRDRRTAENGKVLTYNALTTAQQSLVLATLGIVFILDKSLLEATGLDRLFMNIAGLTPAQFDNLHNQIKTALSQGETIQDVAQRQSYGGFDFDTAGAVLDQRRQYSFSGQHTTLNPALAMRMENDPTVKRYVALTVEAAERHGINGNMLANQFWQESRFNPQAVSPAGAMGIAQFMPFHVGNYGLHNRSDFFDPKTSIEAGAAMMAELTEKYTSQELALVAYNGGGGAISYAARELNVRVGDLSIQDWMGFMARQRALYGTDDPSKWRVQTFDYVQKIAPNWADTPPVA